MKCKHCDGTGRITVKGYEMLPKLWCYHCKGTGSSKSEIEKMVRPLVHHSEFEKGSSPPTSAEAGK